MSRYRFVGAESSRYPVTRLCRMVQVSRAADYQWQEGRGSARRPPALEIFNSAQRRHSALDYLSPVAFEREHEENLAA